jgi:signal transduction histidine kinase
MFDNITTNVEYCRNIVETISGVLYYSHIPTAVIALVTSVLIFLKNRRLLLAQILLFIGVCFSIWSTLDLFIWFNYDNSAILMFSWSLIEIFSLLLFILSLYFLYVFVYKKDVPLNKKVIAFFALLPIVLLSSTNLNITGYDAQECIAIENQMLANYVLGLKSLISLIMVWLIIKAFHISDQTYRKKLVVLAVGILSFIFAFLVSGFLAAITENYILEIYGLMAIIIFMAALARLVVTYGEFNIKIFATQILVVGLVAAISAQFAFIQNPINKMLTSFTVLVSIILGWILVRSVKREVEQREKIDKLAKDLEEANEKLKGLDQLKSEFLSLATHQIRAPLTAIKGYSSMLLEGDYGELPTKARESVETIKKSCQHLVNIVEDFLNISRIEQGRMVYEKSKFDVADLVRETTNEIRPNVENAGLSLNIKIPNDFYGKILADRGKIKQVIANILDNAIKYTPHGGITISLGNYRGNVAIAVEDTGVGIDPSEIGKLFAKFSRAKGAHKTNITGTGLGLYIAKKMAEAHGGDILVVSGGVGKGSTFTIKLPAIVS